MRLAKKGKNGSLESSPKEGSLGPRPFHSEEKKKVQKGHPRSIRIK